MNRRDFMTGALACAAIASTGCSSGGGKRKADYGPLVNLWRGEVNAMLNKAGMGEYASKITLGVRIEESMPPGIGAVTRRVHTFHYRMEGTHATVHHAASRRHEAVHVVEMLAEAFGWKMGPPRRGVKNPEHHPEWFEKPDGTRVYTWKLERYYW